MGALLATLYKAREAASHKYTSRKASGDPRHPWVYYYDTPEHKAPKGEASTYAKESRAAGERGGEDLFAGTSSAAQARKLAPMGPKGLTQIHNVLRSKTGMAVAVLSPRTATRGEERRSGYTLEAKGESWAELAIVDHQGHHKKAGVSRAEFEAAALRKTKTLLAAEGYTFDESRYGKDESRVLVGRFTDVAPPKATEKPKPKQSQQGSLFG